MKFFKVCVIFLLILISAFEIKAQTQEVKFTVVNGAGDISLGQINDITQDKYGLFWFSDPVNRCIIRYDGSTMTRIGYDAAFPDDPNSLGGYHTECILIDDDGMVWIGFYGQGLDRFDPKTNTFEHFRHNPNDSESLSSDFVTQLLVDHLGNFYVGTYGGLDLLDKNTGKFKHFSHKEGDSTSLSCNTIRVLYEDRQGTIWIGTGFAFDEVAEGGLNRFDRNTGTFTRYFHEPGNPNSLVHDKVGALFEDSRGNFWVGTQRDGLHLMDRETGSFTRYPYDPNQPNKLSRPPVLSVTDNVTFINEDLEHHLWIGSGNGVNRYDPATQKMTHFGANDKDYYGTSINNSTWCMYVAQDGQLWMGVQSRRLYRIDLQNNVIPFYPDQIRAHYQQSPTVLWIGTDNGLLRKDLETGVVKKFVHKPDDENSLSNNRISSILEDSQGRLWIGTFFGLNSFDYKSEKFTRYIQNPNDPNSLADRISSLHEDINHNLWIGTWSAGLMRRDPELGIITKFSNNPRDAKSISYDWIHTIAEDPYQQLWIGTLWFGLEKFNREEANFSHYLSGDINSLYTDASGTFWVGTSHGLHRYNKEKDDFENLVPDIEVFSIVEDHNMNLWATAKSQLLRISPDRNHIVYYGAESGIDSEFFSIEGAFINNDGELLFSTTNGHYSFYPDRISSLSDTSKLYFSNFTVNNELLKSDANGPISNFILETDKIKLTHTQNVFSLSFSEIDYRNAGNNKLYYMMENYDQDWRETSPGEQVNYYKVPPGDYLLKVKSANSGNGQWVYDNLGITIAPPWWKTWWAYGAYGLFFICGVYITDRFQRRRLLEKAKAEAREKELEQAKEIEKAYTELKATQSQLIQSEKMASLGELTAGIAHEIQNPLNFVNNFSEVSNEMIDEVNEELDKGDIEEVKYILGDIKGNLEKINHHGKRADAIVKGMLQHSRASTGHKEKTDINALCDEYLRLAYHGLRAKEKDFNAELMTDLDPNLPKIEIIPQDIGRVLLNLINNAFYAVNDKSQKTSEEYEPTVSFSTKNLYDSIEISVKDNGNGIPDSIKEKIFQPFFTTKPTGQGTGLGLSLSYDIVKAHGGELSMESQEGIGTEFIISLPIVRITN